MYHEIDEKTAKRAHEQHHIFSDYKAGQATNEYRSEVDKFLLKAYEAKEKVNFDPEKCIKIDSVCATFSKKLADWYNKNSLNDCRHVSWIVSGRSNYNMNAHNKWSAANDRLMKEYNYIQGLKDKLTAILYGDKIIRSDDDCAIEKINEKIEKIKQEHAEAKKANAEARKQGTTPPYPTYRLQYRLAEIKRLEQRKAALIRIKETAAMTEPEQQSDVDGVLLVENAELMRIQLIFNGKPSIEIRNILKSNGFIWSGKNGAWQRQLTDNGRRAAKKVVETIRDIK